MKHQGAQKYTFLVYISAFIYNTQLMEIQDSIFEKEQIQSVVFDLDDTLFLTQDYYTHEILLCANYVLGCSGDSRNTPETVLENVVENHKKIGRPILLNTLIQDTLNNMYGENLKDRERIFQYIDSRVERFYKNVPQLRRHALSVLNMLHDKGISFGIYSHAQSEWTERKVEYIQNKLFEEYHKEINIPFYSTPLEKEKDAEGWKEALKTFGFDPKTTLVVGDNMKSDIIPAQQAGVENLILLNSMYSNNGVLEDDKNITKVEDIGEILRL